MKNEAAERTYEMLLDRWMDLVASRASLAEAVQELCDLREQDAASRIRARQDAEILGELDDRELVELLEIRDAVARIESGRFGRCVKCGEKIAPMRLEATPWISTCLACAEL